MLWRFKSFLQPFWRFLVWGDSALGKVVKVFGLILLIGGPWIASRWETPGYLILHAFNREIISTPFRFGVLMAILIASFWILVSAGRAYELAGIPELIIDNELVADTLGNNSNFRLRLKAKQSYYDTTVSLIDVINAKGESVLPGRFPIDLEWSHHPGESKIHLKADKYESVSIAMMQRVTLGDYALKYTGARHLGDLGLKVGDKVYFHLQIEHRKRKPIERWFWFEKTDSSTFTYEPSSPLTVTPQANLATSRRAE
jgi:hypothetical protein